MDLKRTENSFESRPDGKSAYAEGGMVSTAHPEATRAGVAMLEKGGNAVDAAVAAAFALSVCEPQASGLGGQSMAVIHMHGRTLALDGSSRAPSRVLCTRLEGQEQFLGHRAATVPSTPAVLGYLHLKFGSLAWEEMLSPAIALARQGYELTLLQCSLQARELDAFLRVKGRSGAQAFLKDGQSPYEPGDISFSPIWPRSWNSVRSGAPGLLPGSHR
jgi:gamma-glutamyltranspeptidase/glutathione hydrolase